MKEIVVRFPDILAVAVLWGGDQLWGLVSGDETVAPLFWCLMLIWMRLVKMDLSPGAKEATE